MKILKELEYQKKLENMHKENSRTHAYGNNKSAFQTLSTNAVGESEYEKRLRKSKIDRDALNNSGSQDENGSLNSSLIQTKQSKKSVVSSKVNQSKSSEQDQILSTILASGMTGNIDNMKLDLTDNQRKRVEKDLLTDKVDMQIDIKKVLRQQLDDHNKRLKAIHDEKKDEEEKIKADRERRKLEKISEKAMVKD